MQIVTITDVQVRTREIARDVLVEAFGASATPFVPVPFVDDWMLARILRRIAGKVLARHDAVTEPELLSKAIVDAYVQAGASPLASTLLVGAARFVVRKMAVVLDVKKSHDVFGESIAFALALDIGASNGAASAAGAARLGTALYRTLQSVGSGPIDALVRAGRESVGRGELKMGQLGDAVGREVDQIRDQLDPLLRHAMTMTA